MNKNINRVCIKIDVGGRQKKIFWQDVELPTTMVLVPGLRLLDSYGNTLHVDRVAVSLDWKKTKTLPVLKCHYLDLSAADNIPRALEKRGWKAI